MNIHPSWEAKPAALRFAIAAQSSARELSLEAMTVLDRLQHLPAARQVTALFVAAAILANAAGLDAHDQISRARRIVLSAEDETLRALGDYAAGELR